MSLCPPCRPGLTGAGAGAILVLLAACSPPPAPSAQDRATQATVSACRQRADEIYQRQNRATLYAQDRSDSPESGSYLSGITTRGLADRFGWDNQVSDCVRNQGSAAATGPGFAPAGTPAGEPAGIPARATR